MGPKITSREVEMRDGVAGLYLYLSQIGRHELYLYLFLAPDLDLSPVDLGPDPDPDLADPVNPDHGLGPAPVLYPTILVPFPPKGLTGVHVLGCGGLEVLKVEGYCYGVVEV